MKNIVSIKAGANRGKTQTLLDLAYVHGMKKDCVSFFWCGENSKQSLNRRYVENVVDNELPISALVFIDEESDIHLLSDLCNFEVNLYIDYPNFQHDMDMNHVLRYCLTKAQAVFKTEQAVRTSLDWNSPMLDEYHFVRTNKGGFIVIGKVYGDTRFPNGDIIKSSNVKGIDFENGYITTDNTRYKLGKKFL